MEKEKLTIEQLAPYLAYGLKCVVPSIGIKMELIALHTKVGNNAYLMFSDESCSNFEYSEFKPLLYPMEYLTEQITHKGEKFIPIDKLVEIFDDDYEIDIRYLKQWLDQGNVYFNSLAYDLVAKLHEWHFAVNIPEHLYINKAEI